eukprot:XP_020404474.1 serine/arginine repetitive matrix protein 1-like [Zea mays]
MASPAKATTSATGSLTRGDDHLSADDSSHLCTGGRRLPQHTRRGPRSRPHYGSEDKTIQERGCRPRSIPRLVPPPGAAASAGEAVDVADLRTARPSPVRWTGSHAPTKRQEAVSEAAPRPSKPGNRAHGGRRHPQLAGPAYPKFASSSELAARLRSSLQAPARLVQLRRPACYSNAPAPRFPRPPRSSVHPANEPASAATPVCHSLAASSGHNARSSLTPFMVEALVCTQDWMRRACHITNEEDTEELAKLEEALFAEMDSSNIANNTDTASKDKEIALRHGVSGVGGQGHKVVDWAADTGSVCVSVCDWYTGHWQRVCPPRAPCSPAPPPAGPAHATLPPRRPSHRAAGARDAPPAPPRKRRRPAPQAPPRRPVPAAPRFGQPRLAPSPPGASDPPPAVDTPPRPAPPRPGARSSPASSSSIPDPDRLETEYDLSTRLGTQVEAAPILDRVGNTLQRSVEDIDRQLLTVGDSGMRSFLQAPTWSCCLLWLQD